MKKVLFIFGTRPEAIKMAPLIIKFHSNSDLFDTRVCITAQHREMLDQVLDFFEIIPDYDLNLMKPGQDLFSLTAEIIKSLKSVLEGFKPDYVFVHGDTTTTLASSLASFYAGAKICHVEAGLRTFNKHSPYPEEINRQLTGRLSDFHFAPTEKAKNNLIGEGITENIVVTGNTVIDSLFQGIERLKNHKSDFISLIQPYLKKNKKIILVTGHRRENHGEGFENICQALRAIAMKREDVIIVYPVHLNPKVKDPVNLHLSNLTNTFLVAPLSYPDFLWLMNQSTIIITDSGGVQEEAPSLGKPVLVMRNTTERPEAVEAGTVVLVGTNKELIEKETVDLLENSQRYKQMSELHNPYGDGFASEKIVTFIKNIT